MESTSGSGNDFRSLLSNFQAATSPSLPSNSSSSQKKRSKKSNGSEKRNNNDAEREDNLTLRERTDRLFRTAQIRRSVASASGESSTGGICIPRRREVRIAICVCVVDDLPHEMIWRRWMEETGGDFAVKVGARGVEVGVGANVDSVANGRSGTGANADGGDELLMQATAEFIHAKHPERISSSWARSKTLSTTYRPNWNDVRVIRAMLKLTSEALEDERTTHVLFCTESCVPITTLKEAARTLITVGGETADDNDNEGVEGGGGLNWNRSFVDYYGRDSPRCSRFDEQSCFDVLKSAVPLDAIHKALPGWCLLSRKHAQDVSDLPSKLGNGTDLWPAFDRVWAPEEVYFPTSLALLGHLPGNPDVVGRAVTYVRSDERARDHRDRAHPIVYDDCFNEQLVREVRDEGCLFLRKLKYPLDVRLWEGLIVKESVREQGDTREGGGKRPLCGAAEGGGDPDDGSTTYPSKRYRKDY